MNRRGFLQSCIALAAAPAIVRADSLMRIVPRNTLVDKSALWVRFTYEGESGEAKFYESQDGDLWIPIGCAVVTPRIGVLQYRSAALGNNIVAGFPPKTGDTDTRICIGGISGDIGQITFSPDTWLIKA